MSCAIICMASRRTMMTVSLNPSLGWMQILQAKPEATVEVSVSESMQEVDFKFK